MWIIKKLEAKLLEIFLQILSDFVTILVTNYPRLETVFLVANHTITSPVSFPWDSRNFCTQAS